MQGHPSVQTYASDSEASVTEEAPKERQYRVRVCLQRFFSDERARCYVWVSSTRRVRWLVRRLQRMFELPAALALVSRGHLLPPNEPLALLAPDDPVDVVRIAEDRPADEKSYVSEVDSGGGDELDSTSEPASAKRPRSASPLHEPAPNTSPDVLCEMKQRALRLLEDVSRVTLPAPPAPPAPPEPRARRRRVRRRRAPRAGSPPAVPAAPDRAPSVRRNEGVSAREPRAVRALDGVAALHER